MNQIKIDTVLHDKSIHLEVTRAFSDTYQVWINQNYDGLIMQSSDGWITHFNRTTILQGDDIAVLIELIERHFG